MPLGLVFLSFWLTGDPKAQKKEGKKTTQQPRQVTFWISANEFVGVLGMFFSDI